MKAPRSVKNDPAQAGQLASKKVTFGAFSRYAVAKVHSRFAEDQWFVWDADKNDPATDRPAVIRQALTFSEAVSGL